MLGETLAEPKIIEPMPREDRLDKITTTEGLSVPALKTCPKCERDNKPAAKFCVKCGHKFS
jgi:hypothetical protein